MKAGGGKRERVKKKERETNKKKSCIDVQCHAPCGVTLYINPSQIYFRFSLHNLMEDIFCVLLTYSS
jgi:hypothetical protein